MGEVAVGKDAHLRYNLMPLQSETYSSSPIDTPLSHIYTSLSIEYMPDAGSKDLTRNMFAGWIPHI